jgi:hypothetical protein
MATAAVTTAIDTGKHAVSLGEAIAAGDTKKIANEATHVILGVADTVSSGANAASMARGAARAATKIGKGIKSAGKAGRVAKSAESAAAKPPPVEPPSKPPVEPPPEAPQAAAKPPPGGGTDRVARAQDLHEKGIAAAATEDVKDGWIRGKSAVSVTDNLEEGTRKVTLKVPHDKKVADRMVEGIKKDLKPGETWGGHHRDVHSDVQGWSGQEGANLAQGSSPKGCFKCQDLKPPNTHMDNPKPR